MSIGVVERDSEEADGRRGVERLRWGIDGGNMDFDCDDDSAGEMRVFVLRRSSGCMMARRVLFFSYP